MQFEITAAEYVLDEVAKSLDLNPNRFCLLGALLGNHILPARELREFHCKLAPELKTPKYKVGIVKQQRMRHIKCPFKRPLYLTDVLRSAGLTA